MNKANNTEERASQPDAPVLVPSGDSEADRKNVLAFIGELTRLVYNGTSREKRVVGITAFVTLDDGTIYPHSAGMQDNVRLHGMAMAWTAAHSSKQVDANVARLRKFCDFDDAAVRTAMENGL